jgi:N utilization substance protein B
MAGKRSNARQFALQALYQWQVTRQSPAEIERQFLEDQDIREIEPALFHELLQGVPAHLAELDLSLAPLLDRAVESVDPVERAILRLGAFELLHSPAIPYRVVIDEAVDLAKLFGAEQGHRYVNGVLDRLARRVRAAEL